MPEITDKTLKNLKEALKSLKILKSICLQFDG